MEAPEPDAATPTAPRVPPLARRVALGIAAVALSQVIVALALGHPADSAAALAYALVSAVEAARGVALLAAGDRGEAAERTAGRVLNAALVLAALVALAAAGWKWTATIGPLPAGVGEQLGVAAGAAVLASLALARWETTGPPCFWDAPASGLYAMQAAAMFVDLSLQRVGYSNRIDAATAVAIGVMALAGAWRRATAPPPAVAAASG